MRRTIIIYMLLVLLTGCSGQATGWQTGNVALVRTVGVDLTEAGVRVSAVVQGRDEAEVPLLSDGTTVVEGVRQLRGKGDGFVHLGHVDQLLLGETFARAGAEPLLDFIARDRQIGPGARLWVLKGALAAQTLETEGLNVSARLEQLARNRDNAAGQKLSCTATQMMSVMAREGSVPVPALRLVGDTLLSDGYAVMYRGRLVGFLDEEQSLGLELLSGQGGGQQVSIPLPDDVRLVLVVRRAEVTVEPVFADGCLTGLNLRCWVQMDVAQGVRLSEELRERATKYAQTELQDRVFAAAARAQFWGTDYIHLLQLVRESCSTQEWSEEDWVAEFRALAVAVEVDARVLWPADMMEEYDHG